MTYKKNKFAGYTFCGDLELSQEQCQQILDIKSNDSFLNESPLSGRGSIHVGKLEGVGEVVVKAYLRGGLLGKINPCYYLGAQQSRPQIEYQGLKAARSFGVSAPEPITFFTKGSFLYRGWLVSRKISSTESLANLSKIDEDRAHQVFPKVIQEIEKLLDNSLFHKDLHPGNILIDDHQKVYLIDFDKAELVDLPKNKLRSIYLLRWRRAVIKHDLPDFLTEYVCAALRANDD